jgi:hypothetical protein
MKHNDNRTGTLSGWNQKVIGIGLPKTGTTSLNDALEILGVRSKHYSRPADILDESWEAYTDNPMPLLAPWLIQHFPDAKFILTTRNEDAWVDSCMRWFPTSINLSDLAKMYRLFNWGGVFQDDPEKFLSVKRWYEGMILASPPKSLLVLPVEMKDKWTPLCKFLGVPRPSAEYPSSNVNKGTSRPMK